VPLQGGYGPTYGATTITVQPQEIIIVGACPVCRVLFFKLNYSLMKFILFLGWLFGR